MRGAPIARVVFAATAVALAALAVLAVLAELQRLGDTDRAAARRALLARAAELDQTALAPGSTLPCVDGTAGEAVGNACEKIVFATAQSTAAALGYMAARIDLLSEAEALARHGDKSALAALASTRRAVALDRYGIAAQVLSRRDGCTPKHCDVFAMVDDADALKANLKAQTFDQYVSRYAANWDAAGPTPAAKGPAVSALPTVVPNAQQAARAPVPEAGAPPMNETRAEATLPGAEIGKPIPPRWHLPSADSIPAVSIMVPEPKLPKAVADRLAHDTARKTEIEQRKDAKDAKNKDAKTKETEKTEAEQKQPAPGAPLKLTR